MEVGDRIVAPEVVTIERGGEARDLAPADIDPAGVTALEVATDRWGPTTVGGVLDRTRARSLVVLHHGRVAYEWYGPGGSPDRRNRCYSVTKSFTGTLAAAAVEEGRLDRAARVGDLLPELAAGGFGGATVGDVADMTVSMAYDEDYADAGEAPTGTPARGFGDYLLALGLDLPDADVPDDAPRTIRTFLATVGSGAGPHGRVFAYATPCTDVLGWLIERASGRDYPSLLTDAIWSRIGAEHDARLSLDPAGTATAGAGLSMTTRDLARFGLALADHGGAGGPAAELVPPAALERIRDGGDPEAFRRGHYGYLAGYSYRDQWWLPGGSGRPLSAWGIHGQVLWVDPDAGVVVATHGAAPEPTDERRDLEQDAMCRALVAASASWPAGR